MSEDERKQLLELYIEAELARKIQELKDTGGFDSDKQVINCCMVLQLSLAAIILNVLLMAI